MNNKFKFFLAVSLFVSSLSSVYAQQTAPRPDLVNSDVFLNNSGGSNIGNRQTYLPKPINQDYSGSANNLNSVPDYSAPISDNVLDRSSRQAEGDYLDINRSIGVPLGSTQDAWSDPFKNK